MFRTLVLCLLFVGCAGSDPLVPEGNNQNNTNNTCQTPPCSENNTGCLDNDGDGFGLGCTRGIDCDDANASRAPDRAEACDDIDNDCDGEIDNGIDCGSCSDGDLDGYGTGCTPGPDCDDTNDTVNSGASERCDMIDNDCDNDTDEDFSAQLGQTCSVGQGACAVDGTMVCSGDGLSVACNATPLPGDPEVCDRMDNDCNGMIDDGIACPACIEDGLEPNDSSLAGTSLGSGTSRSGYLCQGNIDWFSLGQVVAGQQIAVDLSFLHAEGDIEIEFFIGSSYSGGAYSENDNESFTMTAGSNGNATVRLIFDPDDPEPVAGTMYEISR